MTDKLAADGLIARESGEWAETKLDFLSKFGPTAIDATVAKLGRVYIDLFAGPGINVDKNAPEREFESGALRILQITGIQHPDLSFTDAVLLNLEPEDREALRMRVDALDERGLLRIPRERVAVLTGDANRRIGEILRRFNKKDYILVFADPENPSQWPWASVEALRAQGHESIDLYSLLPLEMGIRRLLNFKGRERTKYGQRITAFFGCEDWRPIVEARTTESQSAEMLRQLEDLYLGRLRTLWRYADRALEVRRIGEQGLYRMIFASNHDAGRRIALWARRRAREQKELRLGDW